MTHVMNTINVALLAAILTLGLLLPALAFNSLSTTPTYSIGAGAMAN